VDPDPENPDLVPLVTVTSASTNPVTLSINVIVIGIGLTLVFDAVDEVIVTDGAVLSNV
jgi:hypothetical protein